MRQIINLSIWAFAILIALGLLIGSPFAPFIMTIILIIAIGTIIASLRSFQ